MRRWNLRRSPRSAKQAFQAREFETSLGFVNQILEKSPQNGDALQFRSLVLFADGNYPAAAASAYDALAFGPMWNREAIVNLYSGGTNYFIDLKRLESDKQKQPNSIAHRFLSAYHSLAKGDLATGESELKKMLELAPNEPVATKLLQVVQQRRADGGESLARQ